MANKKSEKKECRHKFVTLVLEESTCEKAGKKVLTCVKCRYNIFQESPKLEHYYQKNENGEKVCIRCGNPKAVPLIDELKNF